MIDRKPKGYWQDFNNIQNELAPLIDKYSRFPSNKEMTKEGLSSLARHIHRFHGGSINVAKKLNVPTYDESIGRRHHHTWNEEIVYESFKIYIETHGLEYFPSRRDMLNNSSGLYTGITQVFGNYEKFKKYLKQKGIFLNKKPKEVKWTLKTVIEALNPIVAEYGYLPSSPDLDKMGLSGLRGFIDKNKMKSALKEHFEVTLKPRKFTVPRESRHWENIDNVENALKQIFLKYGRILSSKELTELGYGALSSHIKDLPVELLEKLDYYKNSNLLITKDGHYVRSIYELLYDNFLSFNQINHKVEDIIAKESGRQFQYDFKLLLENKTIVYIEIWGYTRNRNDIEIKYHEKRQEKEKLYNQLKLKLIGLDSEVFEMPFDKMYDIFTNEIRKFDPNFISKPINLDFLLWGSHYNENEL